MKVKQGCVQILAIHLIGAILAPLVTAQSLVSGDITGEVADPSGAVLPYVSMTLRNTATGETRNTTTNSSGIYRFALVPPGSYAVSVQATGFARAEHLVSCKIGQETVNDFQLAIGSNNQTIEVTTAAALVQADNGDLSTSFDTHLIHNLPNPGNDLTYIAQTAPGVNMNTAGGVGNFQAFGLPTISNLFTVNGENEMNPYQNVNGSGASNLMLGRNEVQEATVTTIGYSGQFGQQAGVQVNYVTKSGTNQFHGNALYWWTGRAMDANDWFNNHTTPKTPRPFANNNQWAGSFGGPIRKNKLFFFVDNEGITYIVPSATAVFSPSPQFSAATLSNLATVSPASVPLYTKMFQLYQSAPGYNTSVPIPGGGCLDLTPTFSGPCFVQYRANPAEPAVEWMLVGRADVNFSDVDRAFFRVNVDHGTQATYADPINSAFSAASYQPSYDGQAQWTHVFGSNATNSLIVAGSYGSAIAAQKNAAATFPVDVDMSGLGYTPMANAESSFPSGGVMTQYQLIDDYTLTKGKHDLKFGANWRRYDFTDYNVAAGMHPYAFVTSVTQFYNGQATYYAQNFPSRASEPVAAWGMGLYAQDEWRVRRNLTLTLVLRLEKNPDPVCQTNCASYFNGPFYSESTDPNAPYNSMIAANRHQILPATDTLNWAPRFGIAWSPGGSGKTVVRAGAGIFYDASPAALVDQVLANIPSVVAMTLCCGEYWADMTSAGAGAAAATSAAAIRNGFASGGSFNSLSASVGPNFSAPAFNNPPPILHTAQYQKWSLQVEQQLDANSSVSLSYVGTHGIHLLIRNWPNGYGSGLAGVPSSPYNSSFSTVQDMYTTGISNYNGATVAFNHRVNNGFQVQASYTWSHALDDVSEGGLFPYNFSSSLTGQINQLCLVCNNYGNADYDIRHSFNAAYVWVMPFRFHERALNQTLAGWTVSQNFFARSGLPLSVFDPTAFLTNSGYLPAQVVAANGQMSCQNGNSQCLNPAAFMSATAYGAFPTQVRNMFRGPSFFDSDFSISKNIKLTERFAFQLGANLYNVFNHPNFLNPDPLISNFNSAGIGQPGGNFGMITRTTAPPTTPYGSFFPGSPSGRIIQIQSKLLF